MYPAPSVILFTVFSGMGFGVLAFLGFGVPAPLGWAALAHWGLGYGLAVGGLLASTLHLGHPERALKAFSQWQTSWLSREAWAAVAALVVLAPVALFAVLGFGGLRWLGQVGAVLCLITVGTTSMIYAQLRSVPRWHSPLTPVLFVAFTVTGGALLTGNRAAALLGCLAVAGTLLAAFRVGDRAFAKAGQSLGTATGLGPVGLASVFEQPHTGQNYLMREMIHVVGRKHAHKLRVIAVVCAAAVPFVVLVILPSPGVFAVAALVHGVGALVARWLFFAEAEHVVGLYYGKR